MSDYGEIITLIIFILISILSSVSNKKKKAAEKAKKESNIVKPRVIQKETVAPQQKEKNLFEVFSEKVETKFSEVDEYFKNLETEMNKKEPRKIEAPKKTIQQEFRVPTQKREYKKVPKSSYANKTYCSNQYVNLADLKRKLNNPKTIKEFVIINEILNKPKALQ